MKPGSALLLTLVIVVSLVACVGLGMPMLENREQQSEVRRLQDALRELQAEVDLAEAEARRAEAESRAEEALAHQLEAYAEIQEAYAEQLRAAGEQTESEADAYVHRKLGEAATRAIDRQGRLLAWHTAKDSLRSSGRLIVLGALGAIATVLLGLLAVALYQERTEAVMNQEEPDVSDRSAANHVRPLPATRCTEATRED